MCGICGLIKSNITAEDRELIKGMNKKLIHRGPDSEGYFNDKRVAIGMRRLKIIDLQGGDQPLYNEDRTVVLVANGEIYNYIELKNELVEMGHHFNTNSDCETIIHAYEKFGEDFIGKLRGMFAFCLYDIKNGKVYLVRDRMAEKPLYYSYNDNELIFASEMKAIINCINKPQINLKSLDFYLTCQYAEEPLTMVENINKIEAAHYIRFNLENNFLEIKKYWDPLKVDNVNGDTVMAIRQTLEEIMEIILRADVPIGVSLSGGLDSSLVAIMCHRYDKEKLHAFTVGYPGRPANDERSKAKKLANNLGFPLHEIELTVDAFVNDFPQMVYDLDEPIGDIAAYGYYRVMKEARKNNIPVILNGIGGDEIFWGYQWVKDMVKKANWRSGVIGNLFVSFNKKHIFLSHEAYQRSSFIYQKVYTDKLKENISKDLLEYFPVRPYKPIIQLKIINELFNLWLYPNCTHLGDRLSMASSVELRSPFLDYRVVEIALGILINHHNDYKLPYKYRLKEAIKDIIPKEILNRRKRGFEPPVKEWQIAIINKYKDIINSGYLINSGLINKNNVDILLNKLINNEFLYRVIVFEWWYKIYIED